ncbi:hypothetical protein LY90DRAFT_504352 [Neocallimastix californiae]|uniref:Uncharacterized protein n=1 Tax=Neocallimastix californiae TaxID=1754190 RepID=A0A1Y2E941_9FUNG|nr:hypothetical protein LY90DRAFT_504352 [Neocallimastix californiae]|eukprot:ORY68088.1 hypothetical protein LY90DRAFT_504352 [Neocallimastix californiae]
MKIDNNNNNNNNNNNLMREKVEDDVKIKFIQELIPYDINSNGYGDKRFDIDNQNRIKSTFVRHKSYTTSSSTNNTITTNNNDDNVINEINSDNSKKENNNCCENKITHQVDINNNEDFIEQNKDNSDDLNDNKENKNIQKKIADDHNKNKDEKIISNTVVIKMNKKNKKKSEIRENACINSNTEDIMENHLVEKENNRENEQQEEEDTEEKSKSNSLKNKNSDDDTDVDKKFQQNYHRKDRKMLRQNNLSDISSISISKSIDNSIEKKDNYRADSTTSTEIIIEEDYYNEYINISYFDWSNENSLEFIKYCKNISLKLIESYNDYNIPFNDNKVEDRWAIFSYPSLDINNLKDHNINNKINILNIVDSKNLELESSIHGLIRYIIDQKDKIDSGLILKNYFNKYPNTLLKDYSNYQYFAIFYSQKPIDLEFINNLSFHPLSAQTNYSNEPEIYSTKNKYNDLFIENGNSPSITSSDDNNGHIIFIHWNDDNNSFNNSNIIINGMDIAIQYMDFDFFIYDWNINLNCFTMNNNVDDNKNDKNIINENSIKNLDVEYNKPQLIMTPSISYWNDDNEEIFEENSVNENIEYLKTKELLGLEDMAFDEEDDNYYSDYDKNKEKDENKNIEIRKENLLIKSSRTNELCLTSLQNSRICILNYESDGDNSVYFSEHPSKSRIREIKKKKKEDQSKIRKANNKFNTLKIDKLYSLDINNLNLIPQALPKRKKIYLKRYINKIKSTEKQRNINLNFHCSVKKLFNHIYRIKLKGNYNLYHKRRKNRINRIKISRKWRIKHSINNRNQFKYNYNIQINPSFYRIQNYNTNSLNKKLRNVGSRGNKNRLVNPFISCYSYSVFRNSNFYNINYNNRTNIANTFHINNINGDNNVISSIPSKNYFPSNLQISNNCINQINVPSNNYINQTVIPNNQQIMLPPIINIVNSKINNSNINNNNNNNNTVFQLKSREQGIPNDTLPPIQRY